VPEFPTAAAVLLQIDGWTDLSPTRRSCLKASVRLLPRFYGRPLESIRLAPTEMGKFLGASAAALGIKASSLAANISNLRSIFRRLDLIDTPNRSGEPLLPEWAELRDALPAQFLSMRLQAFMAYCSDLGILPEDVRDPTLVDYLECLRTRRLKAEPSAVVRKVASAWKRAQRQVAIWPQTLLQAPDLNKHYALPLTAYPASFQAQVTAMVCAMRDTGSKGLYHADAALNGKSEATIQQRVKCVLLAAAALVASGMPPEAITSLAFLLSRENIEIILNWHFARANYKKTDHLLTIGNTLRFIAKQVLKLTGPRFEEIAKLIRVARPKKRTRMTQKRERRLQQFDDPDNEAALLHLPRLVMAKARNLLEEGKLMEAAWLAGTGVAIAIILRCPMRIKNLSELELGNHVIKLDSRSKTWTHFVIDSEEVKNDEPLLRPISADLARLIDEYVATYRPHLKYSSTKYLFPNRDHAHRPRVAATLGRAIRDNIYEMLGLEMTAHDFRAFAGYLMLMDDTCTLHDLQLILGHKTMATTLSYYTSFRPQIAAERYNKLLDAKSASTKARANAKFAKLHGTKNKRAKAQRDGGAS